MGSARRSGLAPDAELVAVVGVHVDAEAGLLAEPILVIPAVQPEIRYPGGHLASGFNAFPLTACRRPIEGLFLIAVFGFTVEV